MRRDTRKKRKKAMGGEPSTEAIRGAEAPQGGEPEGASAGHAEAVHSAENARREAAPENCRRSANPSIAGCKRSGYRSVFTMNPK